MEIRRIVYLLCCLCVNVIYSASTTSRPPTQNVISDDELARISNQLHANDVNGANGLILNFQNRTRPGDRTDKAPLPLFQHVPRDILTRPTYATLMALYDNYAAAVETPEQVTNQELAEENAYLDAIMRTDVMRTAHRFLAQKGLADTNTDRFKQVMKNLWFGMYSRAQGTQGSSGFEHVFLGEQKNGISGLHSWLRYNQEEASGNMEYLGFIKTVNAGRVVIMEMPMKWRGIYKPVSSISIGGSPELEMALYTICFIARPDALCPVQGNGTRYNIQSHTSSFRGRRFVGSTYPSI